MSQGPCKLIAGVVLLAGTVLPSSATAMTGNDWRNLAATAKTAYVVAVVDTLVEFGAAVRSLVPADKLSASDKTLTAFESCIRSTPRSSGQLVAIVDKYAKDYPGQRPFRMSALVFEALRCKDGGGVKGKSEPPR